MISRWFLLQLKATNLAAEFQTRFFTSNSISLRIGTENMPSSQERGHFFLAGYGDSHGFSISTGLVMLSRAIQNDRKRLMASRDAYLL